MRLTKTDYILYPFTTLFDKIVSMGNYTFSIELGTLIHRGPNGKILWRRPLGAFTIGSKKELENAIIRRSGDILRLECNGMEIRLDMATGKVRQVVRNTHFGRKSQQPQKWSVEDLLDQLD